MVNSVTHLFSEQLELSKTEHFQYSADRLSSLNEQDLLEIWGGSYGYVVCNVT